MAKVLCLGEILIDQIASQGNAQNWVAHYGGAPANVACGLAKLGTSAAFIGCIGNDPLGIELLEVLQSNGVDTSAVQIHPNAPTRQIYVTHNELGDRHFQGFSGDTHTIFADSLLNADNLPIKLFEESDFLVMGTLGLASEITAQAMQRALALAEDNFMKVIIDVNWRPIFWSNLDQAPKLINELLLRADFVKFSAEEAEWLYQTSSPRAIAQELDHLEGVIVTNGEQPCRYYLGEYSGQQPAFEVEVADTTGAGDGFLAGFIHQICQINLDQLTNPQISAEIIKYASAVGAITAMGIGAIAAQPNNIQVQNFLKDKDINMGVWGVDSFENDDSADWITEFIARPSIGSVIDTLTLAAEAGLDDYLELAEDAAVITAAEIVAALNHQPSADLPEEIAEWVTTQNEIDAELIDLALQAIAKVKINSELQDLWQNSTSLDEWLTAVNNLEERLKS